MLYFVCIKRLNIFNKSISYVYKQRLTDSSTNFVGFFYLTDNFFLYRNGVRIFIFYTMYNFFYQELFACFFQFFLTRENPLPLRCVLLKVFLPLEMCLIKSFSAPRDSIQSLNLRRRYFEFLLEYRSNFLASSIEKEGK